ncbi:MAG TPA: prolipoprotein diacylglyceryl transferase [Acidimicrobiales bacterium]|nr:prolipoprotein diacylglyceryl transferase [Acidimicrobiales bacterium]
MLASFPSPSSNAIHIGDLQLRAYGLMIALGVFAAVWLSQKRCPARHIDPTAIQVLALRAVPAGLIGARLYHVLTDWRSFQGQWIDAFKIWQGGLGIPGGMLAGVVVGVFYARRMGINTRDLLDVVAPALPLAQAIGRLGNWFNQELFGRPSSLPWAVRIDPEHRPVKYADETSFQPTFLYEMLWNLALVGFLLWLDRKKVIPRGRLLAVYVVGYGVGRLWIELLRIDPAGHLFGVRVNVWVSLLAIVGGTAALVMPTRRDAPVESEEDDEREDEFDEGLDAEPEAEINE